MLTIAFGILLALVILWLIALAFIGANKALDALGIDATRSPNFSTGETPEQQRERIVLEAKAQGLEVEFDERGSPTFRGKSAIASLEDQSAEELRRDIEAMVDSKVKMPKKRS